MTSETLRPREAFVWIWLPGRTSPVVAGRVHQEGNRLAFTKLGITLQRGEAW